MHTHRQRRLLTRQRSNVRPPVATYLRLVAHAPQRDPLEGTAQRGRHAARKRRLARAWRADQAQHRRARVPPAQQLYRNVLHYAPLGGVQAVVLRVERGAHRPQRERAGGGGGGGKVV
jgi:hypothetical protein